VITVEDTPDDRADTADSDSDQREITPQNAANSACDIDMEALDISLARDADVDRGNYEYHTAHWTTQKPIMNDSTPDPEPKSDSDSDSDSGSWEQKREQVLERDDYACRFCDLTESESAEEYGRALDVHHVIPKRDGGTDAIDNLLTLCPSCHNTLESAHATAMGELNTNRPSEAAQIYLRYNLSEMEAHCRWLYETELPKLDASPRIENRKLPGHSPEALTDDHTDMEVACYIMGLIEGLSWSGTNIEGALERDDLPPVDDRLRDRHGNPGHHFYHPNDDTTPDFNNPEPW